MKKNFKNISHFKNKEAVFEYTLRKFSKDSKIIAVTGSTARKPIREFSDIDINIWGKSIKKPHYEIIFVNKKPVLVSIYFYKYKRGKETSPPTKFRILYGKFNDNIELFQGMDALKYNHKESIKRQCQLIIDFAFKYFRSKDEKYLGYIQKRIR